MNVAVYGRIQACEGNSTYASLLASCEIHEVEPSEYLRGLLCLIPTWPRDRLLELAPVNWATTWPHTHTREVLADTLARWVADGDPDHGLLGDWPIA
jgi:hypothetical protein